MRRHRLLALATSLLLTIGVASPGVPTVQAEDAIADANRQFEAAIADGDAAAVAALYTDDAMLMAPNAPSAVGPEAIAEAMQGMLDMGVGSLELTTDELELHGDTAIEVGRYVLEATDGAHMDHGKYIVVWKRAADGWKLHRDIFNSDMAPPEM